MIVTGWSQIGDTPGHSARLLSVSFEVRRGVPATCCVSVGGGPAGSHNDRTNTASIRAARRDSPKTMIRAESVEAIKRDAGTVKLFRDMSIGLKLWTFAGAAALILAVFAGFGLMTMNKVKVNGPLYREIVLGKDLVADVLPPPEYIIETYLTALEMTTETDAGTLADLEKRIVRLRGEYDARHDYWTEYLADGEMKEALLVTSYEPAIRFYELLDAEFLPAIASGDTATAVSLVDGELKAAYDEHRSAIDAVVAMSLANNAAVETNATRVISTSTVYMAVLALGSIAAIAAFSFVMSRYLTSNIQAVGSALRRISSGDFSAQLDDKSSDELGDMTKAYGDMREYLLSAVSFAENVGAGDLSVVATPKSNKDALNNAFVVMIDSLRTLIAKLNANADGLAAASAQLAGAADQAGEAVQGISATSQQVAKGAQDQSRSMQDASISVSELSRTIISVGKGAKDQAHGVARAQEIVKQVAQASASTAQSAQHATEAAREADRAANSGREMVEKAIDGMARIRAAVQSESEKIAGLGQKSAEIGKIVAVIGEIAAQTNLLALNAAIEAARAGEQGRGFAVVAAEVRTLAERASQATKEIAALITAVQKGVDESVKATEQGAKQVAEGSQVVDQAGKALQQIIGSVSAVTGQIEQISAASEEVAASSDEMVKTIEGVSAIALATSEAVTSMSATSEQVARAMESISAVTEESSAAAEEASAGTEEMSAQVEEVVASTQALAKMADELKQAVSMFKLSDDGTVAKAAVEPIQVATPKALYRTPSRRAA